MIEFEHIWVFYLAPIPLLLWWLTPKAQEKLQSLQVPSLKLWAINATATSPSLNSQWLQRLAIGLIWLCLLVAAANPIRYGAPVQQQAEGRDILLAVDISGSMRLKDMTLSGRSATRLQATKAVITEFVQQRQGDRLGLILFGTQAYMHVPLTTDTQTLTQLLNEAQIGYAGRETAIGDAIGLGLKRLHTLGHTERVMILLTDGANSAGKLEPEKAAELAKEANLKIYTIGVGTRQGLRARFGLSGSGNVDESSLNNIATTTGGQFFRAGDTAELQQIYQYIDALEPTPDDASTIRPQKSLAWLGILAALALSLFIVICQLLLSLRGRYGMA